MGIIKKVEAAEVSGDLTFVLSDGTVDRYGDVVDAKGWQLDWFRKNPIALFGHNHDFPIGRWEDVRVEGDRLVARLRLAAEGTSARIDEIRRLIEQGILKAVSVGFKAVESEPMGRGIRFIRQELLECSVVGVPANPAALAVAKSLHVSPETMAMAFGEQAVMRRSASEREDGVNADPRNAILKGNTMASLSERIQAAENDLVREKDALTAHLKEDDADPIVTEELADRIEAKQKGLDALKRAEQALAAKTAAPAGMGHNNPPSSLPAQPIRRGSAPAQGMSIIRAAVVNGVALHTNKDPMEVMERLYGRDETTETIVKAAVAPAMTTVSGWAAELVNTEMQGFIESLRPVSVYPQLAEAGGGRLTFGPNSGAIKVPARSATPSIGGSFIGEGAPIPVRRLALTSVTLTPRKMGVITTFTREMARYSSIQLEAMLKTEIENDTAITLDGVMLGAGAADPVAPAGLLNGATALTATTGGGAAAFLADIRKLRAPFAAANASGQLMLLVNPAQVDGLELTAGPDGTLGWASAILSRYKVATSTAIPVGRVIMLQASDFVSATGDTPEFELSNDAAVHMEDTTPLAIGTAGTPAVVAAPVRSFFQTGVSGLRMIMDVTWAMRRPGMVQYIDGVTW